MHGNVRKMNETYYSTVPGTGTVLAFRARDYFDCSQLPGTCTVQVLDVLD
jgi:hypothetical protein